MLYHFVQAQAIPRLVPQTPRALGSPRNVMAQSQARSCRTRSRSPRRDPDPVSLLTRIQNVPVQVAVPTITMDYYDGFSGMGTPLLALTQSLAALWNSGMHVHLRNVFPFEINADASLAARAIQPNLAGVRHHSPVSACTLPAMMDAIDPDRGRVVSIFEMVPCPLDIWHANIQSHFGQPIMTRTPTGTASRNRTYYVSPPSNVQPVLQSNEVESLPSHVKWPAFPDIPSQAPTLRAIYPVLLQRQVQGTVQPSDRALLRKFMVLDLNSQTARYAGTSVLAAWLGLPSHISSKLSTAFPCQSDQCGQQTLCAECSAAVTVLGRAWHLPTARSIITSVLEPHLRAARSGSSPKHIYLFTSGSPCTRISRGVFAEHSQDPTLRVGPHAYPSNLMWPWHEGMVTLTKKIYFKYGIVNTFAGHHHHRCGDVCNQSITIQQAKLLLQR